MTRRFSVLTLIVLALAACDNAGARQSLAQCMLSPEAKDPKGWGEGIWDRSYLRLCMQAKGYVPDSGLVSASGLACGALAYPHVEAACYRPDHLLAKWWVDFGTGRQISK